jgi:hypothetical protein
MKPIVAFKKETTYGVMPTGDSMPAPKRARRQRVETYTGMRPYYRRTLRGRDAVIVYFRAVNGQKAGALTMTPAAAAQLPAGHTYTIEQRPVVRKKPQP